MSYLDLVGPYRTPKCREIELMHVPNSKCARHPFVMRVLEFFRGPALSRIGCALALVTTLPLTAAAQERGSVTNLPLPRFVSMKAAEGNARRGPSRTHRIDWIFTKRDTPLEITAEHGHWRRVRDRDGMGGWMHYSLLSGVRTVLVEQDMLQMHITPDPKAMVVAQLELGVIARVDECTRDWCDLDVGGYDGWVPKIAIWGVGPDEILK